jgi:surfeit locus 1 family protein
MSVRPSTILLPALVVAAVCVRLGFWQLSRLQQRRAANARTVAAAALPPLQLNDGIGASDRNGRRAIATGSFDRAHEVVLRGFVYQGAPGVRVVTPLRLAGSDSAVLVLRGFVTADDAVHPNVDSLDEPGELEIRGVLQPVATEPDSGGPLPRGGATTWRRLDLAALRARIPYPILDDYLIADRDSTRHGFPIRLEPAALDDGPHLSYALQWFGFAITAVVGAVIVAVRGRAQN